MTELRRLSYVIRETHLALFLGAGASVESGGRTAQEIATGILRKVYGTKTNEDLQKFFEKEYNKIATFENVLEAFGTSSKDRRDLIIDFFRGMTPSSGYRYLAALIKAGFFYPIILTTNFDHMLEDAIRDDAVIETNKTVKVIIAEDLTPALMRPSNNEIIIVKLHGDINFPESLKLTYSQTMHTSKKTDKIISQICEQNGIVIIGYRAGDIGIRNAFQKVKKTGKGWYWISKDILDELTNREVLLLLEKHNSQKNIIIRTFDDFFEDLGCDFVKSQIREKNKAELDSAWLKLERARSFGKERNKLSELRDLSNQLMHRIDLEEVNALYELVQYELDKKSGTYRLQQGVKLLESSIERYNKYLPQKNLSVVNIILLRQLLSLFSSGEQVPRETLAFLEGIVAKSEIVLNKLTLDETDARNKVIILMIEALKEKAILTNEREKQCEVFMKARRLGEELITSLKDLDDSESRYLLGTAYRHMAITYELEGNMGDKEEERIACYQKWMQYSQKAAEILEKIDEDFMRGYALANLGASLTNQINFEAKDSKKKQLLQSSMEYLQESAKCLKQVEDYRGIGWAYIHLSENLRQQINLSRGEPECQTMTQQMESYAHKAVAELKIGEDHLAQGFAYKLLGIASYLSQVENKERDTSKIEKAVSSLNESVRNLEATGYYRACGEALSWMGICQFALWKQSMKMEFLEKSVNSLLRGITLITEGLKTQGILEEVYTVLKNEFQKIL